MPELGALVVGQVVERQAAEQVVDDRRGEAQVRVVGHPGRLEAHVGERLDERPQRHAVLQAVADALGQRVHDPGERRTLLGDGEEHLAGLAVVVLADRREALAVGDAELERAATAAARQLAAHRPVDDPLDVRSTIALDDLRGASGDRRRTGRPLLHRRQRLADLAVVAVDRHGLEAELPRQQVQRLDVLDAWPPRACSPSWRSPRR